MGRFTFNRLTEHENTQLSTISLSIEDLCGLTACVWKYDSLSDEHEVNSLPIDISQVEVYDSETYTIHFQGTGDGLVKAELTKAIFYQDAMSNAFVPSHTSRTNAFTHPSDITDGA